MDFIINVALFSVGVGLIVGGVTYIVVYLKGMKQLRQDEEQRLNAPHSVTCASCSAVIVTTASTRSGICNYCNNVWQNPEAVERDPSII